MFLEPIGFILCLKSAVKSLVVLLRFLQDRHLLPASDDLGGPTQVLLAVNSLNHYGQIWSAAK